MTQQLAPLDSSKLKITRNPNPKAPLPNEELVFGKSFTNHMFTCKWTAGEGWGTPEIVPYGPLSLDPSSCVLHYAFECFEGMKAYADAEGKIRLFRPDKNMTRLNKSASRIVLPGFDGEELTKCIGALLQEDSNMIPRGKGYSMYVRPNLIGSSTGLGVGPPTEALLFVLCSPVGPLYPGGFQAIKLEATDYATRAWPGGSGNAKLGANYAPCAQAQLTAASRGYNSNLWLTGKENYVSEAGVMNVFFVFQDDDGKKELLTAPLDGTILEGVTRDSVLDLCRERLDPKEWYVSEREFTIHEVFERAGKGQLVEAFGCGTAAVVCPIKQIGFHENDTVVPTLEGEQCGALTKEVALWIQQIQYGEKPHKNWSRVVAEVN